MINLIVVLGKIGASIAIANSLSERAVIAPFSNLKGETPAMNAKLEENTEGLNWAREIKTVFSRMAIASLFH
ncbi:MAG: hypothetical protein BRC41_03955 [Cyanobacteria bacterium QH_9_48_43]|nr:MAG: hypothetical protein BRC41_03955 [Cyanobacteria bacterium QH_9_48_43]